MEHCTLQSSRVGGPGLVRFRLLQDPQASDPFYWFSLHRGAALTDGPNSLWLPLREPGVCSGSGIAEGLVFASGNDPDN